MRTKYIIQVNGWDGKGWVNIFESENHEWAENEFQAILDGSEERDFRLLKQEVLAIYKP